MDVKLILACLLLGYTSTCFGQRRLSISPALQRHCAATLCQAVSCPNARTPPGQCCPECPKGPNCAAVICPVLRNCFNPYTPEGECCQRCGTDCRLVFCAAPEPGCNYIPPGGCCPTCKPRQCWHRGTYIEDGDSVRVDCNTCRCRNGNLICTEIACGCPHNGRTIPEGGSVRVDCNTCTCSNGVLQCTLIACDKPGTCPSRRNLIGHCALICSSDHDCPGQRKCCSTGCGRDCMNPVGAPIDCSNVRCPPLPPNCRRIINRPDRCCPICRRRRRRIIDRFPTGY